jgi:hypothetical protein
MLPHPVLNNTLVNNHTFCDLIQSRKLTLTCLHLAVEVCANSSSVITWSVQKWFDPTVFVSQWFIIVILSSMRFVETCYECYKTESLSDDFLILFSLLVYICGGGGILSACSFQFLLFCVLQTVTYIGFHLQLINIKARGMQTYKESSLICSMPFYFCFRGQYNSSVFSVLEGKKSNVPYWKKNMFFRKWLRESLYFQFSKAELDAWGPIG